MLLFGWLVSLVLFSVACGQTLTPWIPKPYSCWNIQLIDNEVLSPSAASTVDFLEVDMEDIPATTISQIHSLGKKVVCYVNVGAYEEWRSDASAFTPDILGNAYDGWPGERWLDVSPKGVAKVKAIMEARFTRAQNKGCDAIDPDNSHMFQVATGFAINITHAKDYAIWVATTVHAKRMSVGLKNNFDLWVDLLPSYDFAVSEGAIHGGIIDDYAAVWRKGGKPVFGMEYGATLADCKSPEAQGFGWVLKDVSLGAATVKCGCKTGGIDVTTYINGQITNPGTSSTTTRPATTTTTRPATTTTTRTTTRITTTTTTRRRCCRGLKEYHKE